MTGCGLLAGTMTRYEGWFLIPFAVLYLLRFRFAEAVKAGAIASIGPVYWLAHNAYLYSDPFEFYHGVGSAKWIYEQALAKGLERAPGDGDFLLAAKYYATAGRLFAGLPLLLIGAVGVVAALIRRAWWPLVFFSLGPVFYAWSIHGSGATIFVPTLWPNTYYNTRYGMIALPMAAFAAAAIPAILPLGNRKFIVAVLVAIGVVRALETGVSAEAAKPMARRGAAATVATRTLRCITNDTSIETGPLIRVTMRRKCGESRSQHALGRQSSIAWLGGAPYLLRRIASRLNR